MNSNRKSNQGLYRSAFSALHASGTLNLEEMKMNEDIKIATLPIGFADGLSKNYEGQTVQINNKEYQIIGEIGMDMTTIKIDDSVKLKDHVIIFDDAKKKSNELGISAYQLFTSITNRVPRIYTEDDKLTEIKY